jgi:hypothetical protein
MSKNKFKPKSSDPITAEAVEITDQSVEITDQSVEITQHFKEDTGIPQALLEELIDSPELTLAETAIPDPEIVPDHVIHLEEANKTITSLTEQLSLSYRSNAALDNHNVSLHKDITKLSQSVVDLTTELNLNMNSLSKLQICHDNVLESAKFASQYTA